MTGDAVELVATVCAALIALSMLAAVGRLVRGPTVADRVVALELLGFLLLGLLGALSIRNADPFLVDAALAISLMLFVTTLVFARFIESERKDEEET